MRRRPFVRTLVICLAAAASAFTTLQLSAQPPATVDYSRDVQPVLRANCYGCHGPALQNGNFRVDRRRDVMPNRVGANGARIVPGNAATSRMFARISGTSAGLRMPPSGPLTAEQIATIRNWIEQGADWPDALAGDTPSPPQDPQAVGLMDALRAGRRAEFDRLLRAFPAAAQSRGTGGSTPLMFAALYGNAHDVQSLLDAGADPNARNDAGATALLWAVDAADKTRALLAYGADPNARSDDGQTPLLLAAARFGASDIVSALLDGGAALKGQPVFGRAAGAGDEALMRLLLARGAERTAAQRDVSLAMRSGCGPCADLLLESAPKARLDAALGVAADIDDTARVRALLDNGATPTGDTLRQAAASERIPTGAVTLFLARGVRDDDALDIARRHGDTDVVAALRAAGAKDNAADANEVKRSRVRPSAREAIERSLPLLQRADVGFLQAAGCVSCHNNSLFEMTSTAARSRGFRIDESKVISQRQTTRAYMESWRERVLQDVPIPGSTDTISFMLAGLAASHYPPDAATDALARYLLRRQHDNGFLNVTTSRPPIESSDIAVTALSIRALQVFAPAPQHAEYAAAVRRAASWLRQDTPRNAQEYAYTLLGLTWARADRASMRDIARKLLALQRNDGGWSQLPTLQSDAYATGLALTALTESGGLSMKDAAYRRGTQFLLDTQLEDGSWFVRSRAIPIQPYFESGFPHGRDQFISAAATNWAAMALLAGAK